MKKKSTRSALVILLMIFSLGSYVFLSTVEPNINEQEAKHLDSPASAYENSEVAIPDMALLKLVMEAGRKILDAAK